jgi:translation initiation factor eIF-2B subunit beta
MVKSSPSSSLPPFLLFISSSSRTFPFVLALSFLTLSSTSIFTPSELAIGNIVRRVLFIVRDEYFQARGKKEERISDVPPTLTSSSSSSSLSVPSLYHILGSSVETEDLREPRNIKANVLDSINDLIEELSSSYRNISDQAIEHIHTKYVILLSLFFYLFRALPFLLISLPFLSLLIRPSLLLFLFQLSTSLLCSEVIMTFGKSTTVENFLKSAGKKRKFELIVVESAPSYSGHETAVTMAQFGINTTLITDSSVFAMMARVNKVIIGTHAVLANGGLIALSGLHMLAQAAAYHSVPVVVCTGLYKLSPLFSYEQDAFNDLNSPAAILKFEEGKLTSFFFFFVFSSSSSTSLSFSPSFSLSYITIIYIS